MSAFLLGVLIGCSLGGSVVFWAVAFSRSTNLIVVDRWWMENADRWEWLREYELGTLDGETAAS